MRSRCSRLLTGILALTVLALGLANPGQTIFRCRYDHIARPICCCPADDPRSDGADMALGDSCCDIETYTVVQPVPQVQAHGTERPAAATAILALPGDHLAHRAPASAPSRAHVEPRDRHGPQIVLLSHSFRI